MVSTLHSSVSTARTLEWQRAWIDCELGYEPTDEERALLEDARRRPEFYMTGPALKKRRRQAPSRRHSRDNRPYRLPFTIV